MFIYDYIHRTHKIISVHIFSSYFRTLFAIVVVFVVVDDVDVVVGVFICLALGKRRTIHLLPFIFYARPFLHRQKNTLQVSFSLTDSK